MNFFVMFGKFMIFGILVLSVLRFSCYFLVFRFSDWVKKDLSVGFLIFVVLSCVKVLECFLIVVRFILCMVWINCSWLWV